MHTAIDIKVGRYLTNCFYTDKPTNPTPQYFDTFTIFVFIAVLGLGLGISSG